MAPLFSHSTLGWLTYLLAGVGLLCSAQWLRLASQIVSAPARLARLSLMQRPGWTHLVSARRLRWLQPAWCLAVALGGASPAQGQDERALDSLKARAQADSNDWSAHYDLAMAYWDQKRWDDAERSLRTALQIAPDYAEAHLALGALPDMRGEKYWKERLKRDGADTLLRLGEEARQHFRRAFLLNPLVDLKVLGKFQLEGPRLVVNGVTVYQAHFAYQHDLEKAVNQLREGRYQEALDQLKEIMKSKVFHGSDENVPSIILWYHGLAAAHVKDYDSAIRDFALLTGRSYASEQQRTAESSFLPLVTNDYRYMLATMLYLGGRLDQAMPVFKRTLEVDLGLFSSHVQLARIYEAAGLPDSALQERRLALDASPDDPGLLLDLGAACLKTGRFSEAATLLGQAAGLNPRDARVPYLQGIVALRLSQTDEARKAFERFLAIAPRRFAAQMDEVRSQLASLNSPAPPGQ